MDNRSHEDNTNLAYYVTGATTGLIVLFGIVLYLNHRSLTIPVNSDVLLGTASCVILLGMFGLYRYAYTLYNDSFYQFLSFGWFLNAFYICFETFFKAPDSGWQYEYGTYLLGLFTSVPFHVARFKSVGGGMDHERLLRSSIGWAIWIFVGSTIAFLILRGYPDEVLSPGVKLSILFSVGIWFPFTVLLNVARAAAKRVDADLHQYWAWIFPGMFYIYAFLQPSYVIKPWIGKWVYLIFVIALGSKIINSIAAFRIIQLDTVKDQELLQQRSVLEDLGALTTSIEHDIKNPLQVIETDISKFKKRFQSNVEVINALAKIEEQTTRILAATQIIPLIRGEREYYEQFMGKTNIKDLVNRSIKAVKKEFHTADIFFNPEQDNSKQYFVKAYSPMLEQGIVNILRNAIEAIRDSDRKGGTVQINFRLFSKPGTPEYVKVEFIDNGIGISEEIIEDLGKIFMTTRGQSKPNSGIGLFITKRILRVHKGWLEFDNNSSGEGANVSLFVPVWTKAAA